MSGIAISPRGDAATNKAIQSIPVGVKPMLKISSRLQKKKKRLRTGTRLRQVGQRMNYIMSCFSRSRVILQKLIQLSHDDI